jgi:hypothetical protein
MAFLRGYYGGIGACRARWDKVRDFAGRKEVFGHAAFG